MRFSEFHKMEKPGRRPEFLDAVKAAGQLMIDRAEDIVPQDLYGASDLDVRVRFLVSGDTVQAVLDVQEYRLPQRFFAVAAAKEGER